MSGLNFIHVSKRGPSNTKLSYPVSNGSVDQKVIWPLKHYNDVIMGAIASQITSLTIVYSTVYSDADQRKHQSSASLAFALGIHRSPVNSPHKGPVTRKKFHLMTSSWRKWREIFTAILRHEFTELFLFRAGMSSGSIKWVKMAWVGWGGGYIAEFS